MIAPTDSPPTLRRDIGERELLTMISSIMALTALAIDLLLPTFDDMRAAYGLAEDSNQVARTITVFFMGLAVAQLFWGPLADRFGRKPILCVGMAFYAAGAVGSALAPSLGVLRLSRFVWGVGAAASRVVATAVIRDRFVGAKMARALSQVMAVFVLVPVFAPSIGAGLTAVLPWRSVFWFCVLWVALLAMWTMRLPETLNPLHRKSLDLHTFRVSVRYILGNRITVWYTIASVFLQGVFTAYLGSSELMISDILGRGDQFPFVFGSVAVLFGLGALTNGRLVGEVGVTRLTHIVFGLLVGGASILLAITVLADGVPSFWIFMPMLGVLLSFFMFILPNLNTGALEPMGEVAGMASSFTGAFRIALGAALGALVDSQVRDTLTPFALALLVFVSLAAISTLIGEGLGGRRQPQI